MILLFCADRYDFCTSLEACAKKAQAYIDYLKSMEILLSPCDYEQVRHSIYLPLARCDRKIFSRAKRNILTEGLAACYPFQVMR